MTTQAKQQYRKDGWPLCPACNEDELASAVLLRYDGRGEPPTLADCFKDGFLCYGCNWHGRVEPEEVK